MSYPQSEFPSRIQAQADLLCQIIGQVDAGDGAAFGDRVVFEPALVKASVPPSVVLGLPKWRLDTYCDDGPGELSWQAFVLSPADDQAVARLWATALAIQLAVEASPLIQAVAPEANTGVWRRSSGDIPAYIVDINAALP